jgi:N-acetylglucosamine kinase-like BadF-type ATPase
MRKEIEEYIIGVDGGGTKTIAALANFKGEILKQVKTGPSSFIKVGVKEAVLNITKAIEGVLKKGKKIKIASTFIGLAAIEENPEMKQVIREALLRQPQISRIFKGKATIGSDQIIGFKSGTNERNGVVLISGTGLAVHGWRNKKESHASGWGWLGDEGSAFWLGQKAYQAAFKDLDERGGKTLLRSLIFRKFKVKTAGALKKKILLRDNIIETVASLAILVDKAAKKGDKIAKNILIEAGKEAALSANTVIRRLSFQKIKFPLVLIGGMFESNIFLKTVKKEVRNIAPKVKFIRPRKEPVAGAVKLALENIKWR